MAPSATARSSRSLVKMLNNTRSTREKWNKLCCTPLKCSLICSFWSLELHSAGLNRCEMLALAGSVESLAKHICLFTYFPKFAWIVWSEKSPQKNNLKSPGHSHSTKSLRRFCMSYKSRCALLWCGVRWVLLHLRSWLQLSIFSENQPLSPLLKSFI